MDDAGFDDDEAVDEGLGGGFEDIGADAFTVTGVFAVALAGEAVDAVDEEDGVAAEAGEFNRTHGPSEAIAHGYLTDGPVRLFASDTAGDEPAFRVEGMMFALLGTAGPLKLRAWFAALSEGGRILDDLQRRPWRAFDGQVLDRFGLHWLIGFEEAETDPGPS